MAELRDIFLFGNVILADFFYRSNGGGGALS